MTKESVDTFISKEVIVHLIFFKKKKKLILKSIHRNELWKIKFSDSISTVNVSRELKHGKKKIYSGLVDGTISVITVIFEIFEIKFEIKCYLTVRYNKNATN